jgi:hypothetical protein
VRATLHQLIDRLDDDILQPALHAAIDTLSDDAVPRVLKRMLQEQVPTPPDQFRAPPDKKPGAEAKSQVSSGSGPK